MTAEERKQRIAEAFGRAVHSYEEAAGFQRQAAIRLADRVAGIDLPTNFRVLEIGCGTGMLSRMLLRDRPGRGKWLLTDISQGMLDGCRQALDGEGDIRFRVMDGEWPDVEGPFDLIVSNLAFQWFDDLGSALSRLSGLLAPGGHLEFTTLARETAREWREAHLTLGLETGFPEYPTLDELRSMHPPSSDGGFDEEWMLRYYAGADAFARALRRTGAAVPKPDHRPLSLADFRRLLKAMERPGGLAITYHVAYGSFVRSGE